VARAGRLPLRQKTLTAYGEKTLMSPVSSKIALFIDGANLMQPPRPLGFDIDYKRLLKEFQGRGTLLRAVLLQPRSSRIRSTRRSVPLIDWLDYNGLQPSSPRPTKEFIDASGRRKGQGQHGYRGSAVDAMETGPSISTRWLLFLRRTAISRSLVRGSAAPRRSASR